ncbi:MAG: uracil-DNA glycosylase [Alphaproteobacteria bacterium]|nr:uracil-DNA glycosylase [Alphaproteobacteria bacterium]
MPHEELKDLLLCGVMWEINETPNIPTCEKPSVQKQAPGALPGTPTIVPPIVPVQTISLSTVESMAARPGDIDSLCRMIGEFNHPLRRSATNVVLPHIAPNPNGVIVLTDMPGTEDDASGQILSGTAGDMIDKMLGAIDMSRDSVSIIPMLFWRTPGGRTPTKQELDLAKPFVTRLIGMLSPTVILTLGSLPAVEFGHVQLSSGHGVPIDMDGGAKLIPIYHPNYLALKPSAKRDVWDALQNIQKLLKTA